MRAVSASALALSLIAACSAENEPPASSVAVPPRASSPAVIAPTPTPTPSPTPKPLTLGTDFALSDGSARVAVLAYRQPVATSGPQPSDAQEPADYVWASAEVRVCATGSEDLIVTNLPWTLDYTDGARIEPSSTGYDNFPKPEYPFGESRVRVGKCLRGNIVYAVPPTSRPAVVTYAPSGIEPVEWSVPPR